MPGFHPSPSVSWSLLKFMSTESAMLSNHLIPCHPLLLLPAIFLSIRVFSSESGGQSIGASASVFPVNIQGWFPLGLTGLISLLTKGLSSLLQNHSLKVSILRGSAFFMVQLTSVSDYCENPMTSIKRKKCYILKVKVVWQEQCKCPRYVAQLEASKLAEGSFGSVFESRLGA